MYIRDYESRYYSSVTRINVDTTTRRIVVHIGFNVMMSNWGNTIMMQFAKTNIKAHVIIHFRQDSANIIISHHRRCKTHDSHVWNDTLYARQITDIDSIQFFISLFLDGITRNHKTIIFRCVAHSSIRCLSHHDDDLIKYLTQLRRRCLYVSFCLINQSCIVVFHASDTYPNQFFNDIVIWSTINFFIVSIVRIRIDSDFFRKDLTVHNEKKRIESQIRYIFFEETECQLRSFM